MKRTCSAYHLSARSRIVMQSLIEPFPREKRYIHPQSVRAPLSLSLSYTQAISPNHYSLWATITITIIVDANDLRSRSTQHNETSYIYTHAYAVPRTLSLSLILQLYIYLYIRVYANVDNNTLLRVELNNRWRSAGAAFWPRRRLILYIARGLTSLPVLSCSYRRLSETRGPVALVPRLVCVIQWCCAIFFRISQGRDFSGVFWIPRSRFSFAR